MSPKSRSVRPGRLALRILQSPARAMLIAVILALAGYIGLHISSAATDGPLAGPAEEILVKYKRTADEAGVIRRAETLGAETVGEVDGTNIKVMEVAAGDKAAVMQKLDEDPRVEYAEPNVPVRRLATTPDDPEYTRQWAFPAVKADLLWDKSKGSPNVILAVIDDGINTTHPEFAGKLAPGRDTAYDDDDATHEADTYHGSIVAGTAAALTNNGTGVAGACWNCRIMPVNVFHGDIGFTADLVEGIVWAADHGAHIINLSLGTTFASQAIADAVKHATDRGVTVVAAAGNDGVEELYYPAAYENVIGVAATDQAGQLADYSQRGAWVDVAAPGIMYGPSSPGAIYEEIDGTSFSSPIVAGVIGVLRTAFPHATPAQLRAAVTTTADNCCDGKIGGGLLNADKAYAYLAAQTVPTPPAPPNPPIPPNPNPTPGPNPKPSDLNKDGKVNITDLSSLLSTWGKGGVPADLNGNGTVDISDLSALLSAWTN